MGTNRDRCAIKKAQGAYWDQTFLQAKRATLSHALKVTNKRKNKRAIPDIQGKSSCERKYKILRDAFFPENVATLSPIPADFLPPPNTNNSDTFITVSLIEVASARKTA